VSISPQRTDITHPGMFILLAVPHMSLENQMIGFIPSLTILIITYSIHVDVQ
jgi:hypothetical protein